MDLEHHRDLAHEFPELKQRVHDLKLASAEFRHLYEEYQTIDNEVHRIEQEIWSGGMLCDGALPNPWRSLGPDDARVQPSWTIGSFH